MCVCYRRAAGTQSRSKSSRTLRTSRSCSGWRTAGGCSTRSGTLPLPGHRSPPATAATPRARLATASSGRSLTRSTSRTGRGEALRRASDSRPAACITHSVCAEHGAEHSTCVHGCVLSTLTQPVLHSPSRTLSCAGNNGSIVIRYLRPAPLHPAWPKIMCINVRPLKRTHPVCRLANGWTAVAGLDINPQLEPGAGGHSP